MKRLLPFLLIITLFIPVDALADKPILTIDTGGHKAKIHDVMFTSFGRYLVSASDDKTIRVWDTSTGEVVRVLRGKISAGFEGKIYAAAISPDNRLLSVGGFMASFTENNLEEFGKIRLIDFQTGEVRALLKGHTDVIMELAFSSDGNLLISGSHDKTARIWNVRTQKTIHVLKGHTDHIYAVAFSPDGKLAVTGSIDDTLKLWNAKSGSLIKTFKGHTDDVVSVAFTPNGKYLLSGSDDKTIRMWDGRTGRFIKLLARQKTGVTSLSISPDGTKVLTGIGSGRGKKNNVFSIPSGKKITSFTKHKNIVMATDISSDGKTAATGGLEGEIYIWNILSGKLYQTLRGSGRMIWSVGFAKDGRSIGWGKKWKGIGWFKFGSLKQSFQIKSNNRSYALSMGPELKSDYDFIKEIKSVGPWSIRTKTGKIHKTLEIMKNGRVVHKVTTGSTSGSDHLSLTLTPDGQTAIIGGSWGYIASYNLQTGKKIHDFIGHTGDVWEIAASPDSRLLVSGSADQTVRLWEVDSGKLLLTIFQGTDNEWVAWTPEGFFDSSPGGVKYIGYHINRGEDKAAEYVRVDQVYDQFYRPDLVAMKLEGGHEDKINAELSKLNIDRILAGGMPPTIEFISPRDGESMKERNIKLKIKLTDKGGGIGKIVYRINGVTIGTEYVGRGIKVTGAIDNDKSIMKEKLITLQPKHNRIIITAYNEQNEIESRPASINLILKDVISEKPSLYVLSVGISDYRDHALKLIYSVPDSKALADEMRKVGKNLFDEVIVETLFDREATLEGIENIFDKLTKEINANDVFVFYVAGHGLNLDGKYHFIPWELIYQNEDSVRKKSLTQERMQALLAKIPALKSVVFLDTCNSGAFAKPSSRGLAEKTAMDKLMRATGRATIAASSESQVALEGYKGHGVFTYTLLQALKGSADKTGNRNGEISINELAEYVSDEVPKITFEKWGYEQFPMQNLYGRSFPIGLVK